MKAAVLLSGGIDSTTCLALAIKKLGPHNVIALNMHYGQKHDMSVIMGFVFAAVNYLRQRNEVRHVFAHNAYLRL